MDFFTSLLHAYEAAEKTGLVDNHQQAGTKLLPIYHSSSRSHGNDIIVVQLDKNGQFVKADFLASDETIIFPVTADSVARSGKDPAPHPLVDKLSYFVSEINQSQYENYHSQLENWIVVCQEGQIKSYLTLIQAFIKRADFLQLILQSLYGNSFKRKGLKITYPIADDKTKTVDLSSCFLEFQIDNFIGQQTVSVTNFKALHDSYISYVEELQSETIVCNISGQEETLATKHRGLLGNAKLISVSNNNEMYKGRFKEREDVFTVGNRTSEKIHLMAKFFLEHDKAHTWLGGAQHLINWFSDDLTNESDVDITVAQIDEWDTTDLTQTSSSEPVTFSISESNEKIGRSFIRGEKLFSDVATYYVAILNKTSNGRISLKYFRQLQASKLLENLDKWQANYSWEAMKKGGGYYQKTPSFNELILAAYGVDRERFLELDNDSFKSVQYQQLITALLDGQAIPRALVKKLEDNIKQRQKYSKHWYQVQQVSLAVLHKQDGRNFTPMLDHENKERSYLFGRLLAIFELIESQRYALDGGSQDRITNAERYWTAYTGQPAKMMTHLENKVKPYEEALKLNRPRIFHKLEKERREIIELLTPLFQKKDFTQALDYQFIFGYYAEKKYFYTKQVKESEEE